MSSSQIALLAILLGPLLSILGTILVIRWTRKSDKEEIKVSEKDSATAQFVALTEGYQQTFAELRLEVGRLTQRVTALEEVNAEQKSTIEANTKERAEILSYLERVEALVPMPPGPPPRPNKWHGEGVA